MISCSKTSEIPGYAAVVDTKQISAAYQLARERCPHCGRMRVAMRESCEHCGKGWPSPAADGTEIFEP